MFTSFNKLIKRNTIYVKKIDKKSKININQCVLIKKLVLKNKFYKLVT